MTPITKEQADWILKEIKKNSCAWSQAFDLNHVNHMISQTTQILNKATNMIPKEGLITTIYNYSDDDSTVVDEEDPLYGHIILNLRGIGVSFEFTNLAEEETMDMILTLPELKQHIEHCSRALEHLESKAE